LPFCFGGGSRAFTGSPRLPVVGPSGLAGAPKVASAPRGPATATLAGSPVQSLPLSYQRHTSQKSTLGIPPCPLWRSIYNQSPPP
jgi:hypothetical protein